MYILRKPKVEPSQKIYSGGRFWDLPPWVVRTKGKSYVSEGRVLKVERYVRDIIAIPMASGPPGWFTFVQRPATSA